MPVDAYVGLPGSGKSYSVVEHVVIPGIKARRVVVTNIPLKRDLLLAEYPDADIRHLDVGPWVELGQRFSMAGRDEAVRARIEAEASALVEKDCPAGALLVLDECWRVWPAARGQKDSPMAFRSLLAEHRHRVDENNNSLAIVLVTQDLAQIAPWARALVEQTFRTVKMSHLGSRKSFRVDVYQGAVTGPRPPKSQRLRQIGGRYKASVYRFYESHTMREGGGSGANEAKLDERGSLWSGWLFRFGLPLVVLVVVGFAWYLWGFFHPEPVTHAEVERPGGKKSGQNVRSGLGSGSGSRWEITGTVEFQHEPARSVVFLTDGVWRVTLPLERNCRRFAEGWLECSYRGQLVSNELERVPVAASVRPMSVPLLGNEGS